MSTQGGASNDNGLEFERKIGWLLESLGHTIQWTKAGNPRKAAPFPGPNPNGHRPDFDITVHKERWIVECKSFGGMAGTIWEKHVHAINLLGMSGRKSIILFGGQVPKDWRWTYLFQEGQRRGVLVMTEEEFGVWLRA